MIKHLSINQTFRLLVSLVFLLSGLIKLNDPIGFSLTIEIYLRGFAIDFSNIFLQLLPYSLSIAMSICILEIVLGMAFLINFQTKFTIHVLFILTGFFTLLTVYTLWFKRVDSCGCLSDAIPLAPRQSFIKNILLLFILYTINKHTAFRANRFPLVINLTCLTLAATCSAFIGWYTFNKLPIIDFGQYQVGKPISKLISPITQLENIFGLEAIGTTDNSRNIEPLRPASKSTVTNFIIWNEEKEITLELLQGTNLICILQRPAKLDVQTKHTLTAFAQQLLSPVTLSWLLPFHEDKESLSISINDRIVWGSPGLLGAIIKADIGFILLQNGLVVGKWSYKNLAKMQKHLSKLGLYKLGETKQ